MAPDVSVSALATQTAALVAGDLVDLVLRAEAASIERAGSTGYVLRICLFVHTDPSLHTGITSMCPIYSKQGSRYQILTLREHSGKLEPRIPKALAHRRFPTFLGMMLAVWLTSNLTFWTRYSYHWITPNFSPTDSRSDQVNSVLDLVGVLTLTDSARYSSVWTSRNGKNLSRQGRSYVLCAQLLLRQRS